MRLSILFWIVMTVLSGAAAQDSLVLRRGGVLYGEIVYKNRRQVMIETQGKVLIMPQSDILSVNYNSRKLAGRRWALGIVPGISFGGTGKRTAVLLEAHGFSSTKAPNNKPNRGTADPAFFIEATYLLTPQWRLGLQAGVSNTGNITGYRSSPSAVELPIHYAHYSFTPFIRLTSKQQYFHLMAGPSVFVEDYYRSEGQNYPEPSVSDPQIQLGLMIGVGVSLLERARHYLHLQGQYFFSGSRNIGPYGNSSVGPLPVVDAFIPEEQMSFRHFVLTMAYGWKIRGS